MMTSHKSRLLAGLLSVLMIAAPGAHAQLAVIDAASLTRLIQQAQTLTQQLEAARQQVAQAQALYQSTTGNRGMQQLLSGVTRNYLPTDWTQLSAAAQGSNGASGALASDIHAAVTTNALLSGPQMSALSADEQAQITNQRRAVALQQALAQEALVNSSGRFASIQQLIGAIVIATDQKGILELQSRINAEQGMLQNEQTKLQVLNQAAQSQSALAAQLARERIIAGQGRFATRFEPAPL
jgi:type IV secretion system protein VirB5